MAFIMFNTDILDVSSPLCYDNSLTSIQYHTYLPEPTSYAHHETVRFVIENQDLYTLPAESYLRIEGKFQKSDPARSATKFPFNGAAHLFSYIGYQLNGVLIDEVKQPGITTALKDSLSYETRSLMSSDGYDKNTRLFTLFLSLKHLLGFGEDYQKVLINIRQELILIRAASNLNAFTSSVRDQDLEITSITWHVPHVSVNQEERHKLNTLVREDRPLPIGFMTWELHQLDYITLGATEHTWTLKTVPASQRPRYVLLGFQTNRQSNLQRSASVFDHCDLTTAKLYLNNQAYPYDNIVTDYQKNEYHDLYRLFSNFHSSYYGIPHRPFYKYDTFKTHFPVVVFDVSRQEETVEGGSMEIRLEWKTRVPFPPHTLGYCLILREKVVNYRPLSCMVQV